MKHYIIFALFVFLFGCNRSSNIDKKTAEKVQQYITDINEICFTDNGELWDFDLIGSIIFVNP